MAREREVGQVLPLVAALMVVCGLAAIALGRLGERAAVRARAQAAADAVALAGAVEGRSGADRLAASNGGRLVSFVSDHDGGVRVDVDVGGVVARARAEPAGGAGGMAPAMAAAVASAGQVLGSPVHVVRVVAPGLDVEIGRDQAARLAGVTDQTGLCMVDPIRAPARFEICPPPATALGGSDGT